MSLKIQNVTEQEKIMEEKVKIKDIINCIETVAPLYWQEDYDNAGLIIGNRDSDCTGVLICFDVFADTVNDALQKNCNLIISHHPFIYNAFKQLCYGSDIEKILRMAVKNDIAIYAAHTNMDNALTGVSHILAEKLGLQNISPLDNSRYPADTGYMGGGAIGELQECIKAEDYLIEVKKKLNLPVLRCIGNTQKEIKRVGVCGGSGSFLIGNAIDRNCDMFLTADLKYHDFLSYENEIILADIGHFESEIFIKQRFFDIISKKMCNFAPLYISEELNRIKFL